MTENLVSNTHFYQYDNVIVCILKNSMPKDMLINDIRELKNFNQHAIEVIDMYNENEDCNKDVIEGKLLYRKIDRHGNAFKDGTIQIYDFDRQEVYYFRDDDDFLENFTFKEKPIGELYKTKKCLELPIVDLSTYLYFRPHINYDCNFIYKGVMYILGGASYPNMDFYPNYGIVKFMDLNDIDYFKKPDKEDVYQSPLELLENYVLHDGTRLWDIKEEYIFEWYKKAFIGLVEQYL